MSLDLPASFERTVGLLRAVAEPTRLRLLALLARAELTVGELCDILGQSQPRVSRHLKLLGDAGILDRFREQHCVYYRAPAGGGGREAVRALLALADPADPVLERDRMRLQDVIAARARAAVAQLSAGRAEGEDEVFPEEIERGLFRALGEAPIGVLLDVGTGGGRLLALLSAQATRAVGVDISRDALRLARTNVHGAGLSHCEFRHGDMYRLPFEGAAFDTATIDRVLGDAAEPVRALAEITRTLHPGGRVVVVEDFDRLADLHPNPIAVLRQWFAGAGLECVRLHPLDTESRHLLVAIARRPLPASAAA
ncbi:MAG: ArsR family transcriptional regulator [Proteobacteria bacterium]|nr:MAG: ArsR family transcriptional regulator [Pseudomonadota bacterium]